MGRRESLFELHREPTCRRPMDAVAHLLYRRPSYRHRTATCLGFFPPVQQWPGTRKLTTSRWTRTKTLTWLPYSVGRLTRPGGGWRSILNGQEISKPARAEPYSVPGRVIADGSMVCRLPNLADGFSLDILAANFVAAFLLGLAGALRGRKLCV